MTSAISPRPSALALTAKTGWTPTDLWLDAFVTVPQGENVTAKIASRFDFRTLEATPEKSNVAIAIFKDDKQLMTQNKSADVTAEERSWIAPVRDAFAGSALLAQATDWKAEGPALGNGRISWTAEDGTRKMVEMPASQEDQSFGDEKLAEALKLYLNKTGLDKLDM